MRNKVLINHIIFKSKRKKEKLLSVNQNHNSVDETHFTIFFSIFVYKNFCRFVEILPRQGNFTCYDLFRVLFSHVACLVCQVTVPLSQQVFISMFILVEIVLTIRNKKINHLNAKNTRVNNHPRIQKFLLNQQSSCSTKNFLFYGLISCHHKM